MQRYAVVNEERTAILRFIEVPDGQAVLPVEFTKDEPGENEIRGPVIDTILADRVHSHRGVRRALMGMVAKLSEDGKQVLGFTDLGPELVAVKPSVVPVEDVRPPLGAGQVYGAPAVEILDGKVRRTWPVEQAPEKPEPTLDEKLAQAGLTRADIKQAASEEAEALRKQSA